jgi:2-methylfumaryl-CoA isomerase
MIVVVTPRQWANLVTSLGVGEPVAEVERTRRINFTDDDGLRFANRDALFPIFDYAIGNRSFQALTTALDAGGVVYSTYQTMLDAAHDRNLVTDNPIFSPAMQVPANPSGFAYPAAGAFATVPELERQRSRTGTPASARRAPKRPTY